MPQRKTYDIVQVGWGEYQNNDVNMVLLSRKERDKLGVDLHDVVKVKKGRKAEVAIVDMQFRSHTGKAWACTINAKLAECLNAVTGNRITITKEVTETEYKEFIKKSRKAGREHMQRIVSAMMRRAQNRLRQVEEGFE